MSGKDVSVQKWAQEHPPSEAEIRSRLSAEGLTFYRWSNAPGNVYAAHTHPFPLEQP